MEQNLFFFWGGGGVVAERLAPLFTGAKTFDRALITQLRNKTFRKKTPTQLILRGALNTKIKSKIIKNMKENNNNKELHV